MPLPKDYTYCTNSDCPLKDRCDRFRSYTIASNNGDRCWIGRFEPSRQGDFCRYFIEIEPIEVINSD